MENESISSSDVINWKFASFQAPPPVIPAPAPEPEEEPTAHNVLWKGHKVRTQKVAGMIAAKYSNLSNLLLAECTCKYPLGFQVWPYDKPSFPCFARPCPSNPRHGFVDSKQVFNSNEFIDVVEKTLREDQQGEILCMPFIEDAKHSFVVSSNGVTIGGGHDGATSGNGIIIHIPCNQEEKWEYCQKLDAYRTGVKDTAYVEIVYGVLKRYSSEKYNYIVQLRDGPKQPMCNNFVPKAIAVKIVHQIGVNFPAPDLLEWEKTCKYLKTMEGLVVHHPGGAIGSHIGVHCIENNIPYVTDYTKPDLGEKLKSSAFRKYITLISDRRSFAGAAARGLSTDFDLKGLNTREVAMLCFSALHSYPYWGGNDKLWALAGFAAGATARLMMAACIGETRHSTGNDNPVKFSDIFQSAESFATVSGAAGNRNKVYRECFGLSPKRLTEATIKSFDCFNQCKWTKSYGGKSWARCALAALVLSESITKLCKKPTVGNMKSVMEDWNRAVNVMHNCGVVLSKYTSKECIGRIEKMPSIGFITPTTVKVIEDTQTTNSEIYRLSLPNHLEGAFDIVPELKKILEAFPPTLEEDKEDEDDDYEEDYN